ncbi:aldose epimerase family protein [Yoonia sp.]|uniref:aldose epimerase family protein n=1 Tax=Yoonia sp. TaxID=2212373 RepID=UPI0025CD99D8|nr:aldose epimerase family protein [Yoonia sp.]
MVLFGTTKTGRDVHKITLRAGDLTVQLLTWGAVIQDIRLDGIDRSLTLGSDNLADYEGAMRHHGALIGPVANRISNARVRLDGMMYELERNEKGHIHLHSGAQATHLQVWDVAEVTQDSATLTLRLPDGMCGLPGNRQISATFTVTAPATLTMTVTGRTDTKTLMNLANHSYWNLDGAPTWAGHRLRMAADHFLPCTPDNYPTGDVAEVAGTAMDFTTEREMIAGAPALDHNFCLSYTRQPLRDVLWLTGQSGVQMTLATTEPGLQIYDGRTTYAGVAIEAQCWPDAPNNRDFPSIILAPDDTYRQTTSWSFPR